MKRVDNVVSLLRHLLYPARPHESGEEKLLRRRLVVYQRASAESGPGYRLAGMPLLWLDVEEMNAHVKRARRLEQFGEESLSEWRAAYDLGMQGSFLPQEPYSDWATWRRIEIETLLWDCVRTLWHRYVEQGEEGEDQSMYILRNYWQSHVTNEDALRPLLELLGKREQFGQAEAYYEQLCTALAAEDKQPDQRTREIMDFLRATQIQRLPGNRSPSHVPEKRRVSPDKMPISSFGTSSLLSSPRGEGSGAPSPSKHTAFDTHNSESLGDFRTPQLWYIPHLRNPFFTGREELLTYLHNIFLTGKTIPQLALCGLGGIGKTQLALEYAYRYRQEYKAIFWVKADTRDNMISDFLAFASLLELPERDAQDLAITLAAIKQWLQEKTGWLLIFDNADDLILVREFLPTGHRGHILLTTRAQATGRLAHRIDVGEMDLEVGTLFLLRRIGFISPDGSIEDTSLNEKSLIEDIVRQLGGLPLALDQAGAYIEETGASLQEYAQLYKEHRTILLRRRGGLVTDHPEPVATTWLLSFEQVEDMDVVAADVLRLCAFLDPDAIAEEIFTQGAKHVFSSFAPLAASALNFHQVFETLRKFSLLRRNPDSKLLTIHRLVQASIQDAMDQATQRIWAERTIQALEKTFPSEITVSLWPQCQRLLSHVRACMMLTNVYQITSLEAATVFNQAGYFLRERALYKEAEQFYQRALTVREQILGSQHPETAQVLYNLARLYYDLGQYSTCEKFHLQALEIRKQTLPTNHIALALSLNSLAFLYYIQNRNYDEAERLYQQALSIFDVAIGMDHPKTAHCLSNLALLYASQEKSIEAEQLLLRVQEIRERHLGMMHLDTARSLQNLAWFYVNQERRERYGEAKQLLERSLAIRETLLGSEHPQIAISLNHLALLCEAQGDYAGAKQFYLQALTIRRKTLGDDNPKVLLTEACYAALLRKIGLDEEAAQLEYAFQAVRSDT
jgi:tetratricopeptide (TPR) repeat protein